MSEPERFEVLILGSGFGGKLLAWHMAQSGRRTAVVERQWIGGSCPNIACLPSKNEIWSARIAHQAHHAAQFGTMITGPITTDMAKVRQRKRDMVEREIELHLHNYRTTGAELIMGSARFVAPTTLEVRLNDGGTRVLAGDQVFLNLGTHALIPAVPGLERGLTDAAGHAKHALAEMQIELQNMLDAINADRAAPAWPLWTSRCRGFPNKRATIQTSVVDHAIYWPH